MHGAPTNIVMTGRLRSSRTTHADGSMQFASKCLASAYSTPLQYRTVFLTAVPCSSQFRVRQPSGTSPCNRVQYLPSLFFTRPGRYVGQVCCVSISRLPITVQYLSNLVSVGSPAIVPYVFRAVFSVPICSQSRSTVILSGMGPTHDKHYRELANSRSKLPWVGQLTIKNYRELANSR